MRACRNVEGPLGVRVCLPAAVGMIVAALFAPPAAAQTASFPFTGGEQTYVVPPGFSTVAVTAVGGAGGSPPQGGGLPGGRGAIVSGRVLVTPGQVLYVWVGSSGGNPGGGFNGGAPGGMTFG